MKNSDYFEFGDVPFAFQVTGVRDGFEDEEVIVDITAKKNVNDNISQKRAAYNEKVKSIIINVKKEKKTEKK